MEQQQARRQRPTAPSRRAFLRMCLALPTPVLLSACLGRATAPPEEGSPRAADPPSSPVAPAAVSASPAPTPRGQALPPTPACGDDAPTPSQTEGPYFTPNSPQRASLLEPGVGGTRLVVSGFVLTTDCKPVARALLDFWQADERGQYDNVGYRLRGHQFTDDAGRYRLETIVPGLYPARTRHIHVKVQAPNQPVLTTQLYFAGEPRNASDGLFRPALAMEAQDSGEGKEAMFTFVLRVS